jgi:hypothetical protein
MLSIIGGVLDVSGACFTATFSWCLSLHRLINMAIQAIRWFSFKLSNQTVQGFIPNLMLLDCKRTQVDYKLCERFHVLIDKKE